MDSSSSKNIKTVMNSNFCNGRISKTGKVIFSKSDLGLTYEVTRRGSSSFMMEKYDIVIWLDNVKSS